MDSLILNRQWRFPDADKVRIQALARERGVPELIACFLYNRGINSSEELDRHLNPTLHGLHDPASMAGMEEAIDRLVYAVRHGERIGIFGDYDADGVSASALVYLFLQEIGVGCEVYIPHREQDGYGLNPEGLEWLAGRGCSLIVTVDCGIGNVAEIEWARQRGLDIIVTDHHLPPEVLPPAIAVVNPRQSRCPFPFKELAGVGVAFNLIRALRGRLYNEGTWSSPEQVPNLKKYLDLVAIGTVADVMPLVGDNRVLVKAGFEVLEREPRPGLKALLEIACVRGDISAHDIGFRLAPRINAAGRVDHAEVALRLLVTSDRDEAAVLAKELQQLNNKRQAQEGAILKEALSLAEKMGDRHAYVLSSSNWKKGVLGIVASRLSEQLKKPVLLLCREGDELHGSGRCPVGFNLHDMLSSCSKYLLSFGGHKAAAGLRLHAAQMDAFVDTFEHKVAEQMGGDGPVKEILGIDAWADLASLTDSSFFSFLSRLEPFGEGFPRPLVALKDFELYHKTVVGNRHLKLRLGARDGGGSGTIDLLAWGHGDKIDLDWQEMELACFPEYNNWNGTKRIQLVLKDARCKHRL